jgi:hypothetical protein
MGQHRPRARGRICSEGRRQIDKIDSLGGATQFFLDDRPAAPCL